MSDSGTVTSRADRTRGKAARPRLWVTVLSLTAFAILIALGVGDFVEGMARSAEKSFEQVEAEFFDHVRPTSLIKRFAAPGTQTGRKL